MSTVQLADGTVISTKAALVQASEEAFNTILTERPDSPPESKALLDAGLVALRKLRDNPLVMDETKIIYAMSELTYAITAAAGMYRTIILHSEKCPPKALLN